MPFTKIINILYSIAFACLIAYLSFSYRFAFNYETYLNQQYPLIFMLPIVGIVLIWLLTQKYNDKYSLYIGLFLIICFSSLLCFSTYYTFSNEYFFTLGIITMTSYCLYWLRSLKTAEVIILMFIAVFIFQLYTGLQQIIENEHPLAVSGSLQNSGVFAYYLVCNLPLVYWFLFTFGKRLYSNQSKYLTWICRVIYLLISLIVFYMAYYTQSRTAIISFFIGICYLIVQHYKINIIDTLKRIPNVLLFIIGAISFTAIIWASIWLYNVKKLSAVGRLFSIQVSLDNIPDHLWCGTGLGRFTWYYPQWQSAYFEKNLKPNRDFFLSADESYIIFNEFLQLFSTIGILGFSLCIYGIYRFFKLKSASNNNLLSIVKCTVLLILCCGVTSYPLHVNVLLLLLGSCIAIGFLIANIGKEKVIKKESSYRSMLDKTLISFGIILLCLSSYNGYKTFAAAKQWSNIRDGVYHREQNLKTYEELYPVLYTDGKFLIEYGALLNTDTSDTFKAISILEEAKKKTITRVGIEALVKVYKNDKKYDVAIQNQLFLTNYLPNKFQPKYDLLQLYIIQNDTVNIRQMCQVILEMPVKINSYQVTKIKKEANAILKEFDN